MNPSLINELDELINIAMNFTTAASPNTDMFVSGIRTKSFIVGSFTQETGFSTSATPVVHTTRARARQECNRLAKLTPGRLYVFLELSGAELQPVTSTLSI